MITQGERREPERPAALNHCGHNPCITETSSSSDQPAKQHIKLGALGSTTQGKKNLLSIPPTAASVRQLQPPCQVMD